MLFFIFFWRKEEDRIEKNIEKRDVMIGRQTIAKVHLEALKHNYRCIDLLAENSKTIAVVKADAYGHGAVQVSRALAPIVDAFAVAFFDEAQYLREHEITHPILLLEGPMSCEEIRLARALNFWLAIHSAQQFTEVMSLPVTQRPTFWLKVDTGMHRLGVSVDTARALLQTYRAELPADIVLSTHLSCADEIDNPVTQQQVTALKQLADEFDLPISIANSAAIQTLPSAHGKWNRLGLSLYGASPSAACTGKHLMPVMQLEANVIAVRTIQAGEFVGYSQTWQASRTSTIATVAIGYADGYPRHAQVGTPGYILGKTVPLVGRVSMDMVTFDVTDVGPVSCGDKVELWGNNVAVETVAQHANTISYALLAGLSARVKRHYLSI